MVSRFSRNTKNKAETKPKSSKSENPGKPEKINVTPELLRIWLTVRNAWGINTTAFSNTLSQLDKRQAELLYGLVKCCVYKLSYVNILHEHPELRRILLSDFDRLCMRDVYDHLSYRLGKFVQPPADVKMSMAMFGAIGREASGLIR